MRLLFLLSSVLYVAAAASVTDTPLTTLTQHITDIRSIFRSCHFNVGAMQTLNTTLTERLIAQPAARSIVNALITAHLTTADTKPLILSLHGDTGTGKSFTSKLISQSLAPQHNVHRFHGKALIDIGTRIVDALRVCPSSIIVIEEIDFVPADTLSAISYLFDENSGIPDVDTTRAIYVFTSNLGGRNLSRLAWEAKKQRTDTADIDPAFVRQAIVESLSTHSALTALVDSGVLTHFVPYYPLFKSAVKECIRQQLNDRRADMIAQRQLTELRWSDDVIDFAVDRIRFVDGSSLSYDGCKPVADVITVDVMHSVMNELYITADTEAARSDKLTEAKSASRASEVVSWMGRFTSKMIARTERFVRGLQLWSLADYNVTLVVETLKQQSSLASTDQQILQQRHRVVMVKQKAVHQQHDGL